LFNTENLQAMRDAVRRQTQLDKSLLDTRVKEVAVLKTEVRRIRPRATTAVSLVAADGGNNQLVFDPFHVQLVRVVDSYGQQLFLDVISPSTDPDALSKKHVTNGVPSTPLGRLMIDLGVETLHELSPMIPEGRAVREEADSVSPSWVLVYRDLCEWAVLYDRLVSGGFQTNTLIVRDGPLRSKLFRGELFIDMKSRIAQAIERVRNEESRSVFLVGVFKHSQVVERYRLAMMIDGTFASGEPRYVRIPRELEAKAYKWPEYSRGSEGASSGGEAPKFVIGGMFFARFGRTRNDPIWAVDVFEPLIGQAEEIFGYLLRDAIDGFPMPHYPRCLQKAHEHAQIANFDREILQDAVVDAVRGVIADDRRDVVDAILLAPDVANARYE
jgi:hypothetical protein